MFDLRLMQHYLNELVPVVESEGGNQKKWRVEIPDLAFSYPFTLHALLALSALHLSQQIAPESRLECKERAADHFALSLPPMIEAMNNVSDSNSTALFAASMLITLYYFALGPPSGHYLGFSDEGEPEWLYHLRGTHSLMQELRPELLSGWFDTSWEKPSPDEQDGWSTSPNAKLLTDSKRHILDLRNHISTLRLESEHFEKYLAALDLLDYAFTKAFSTTATPASPINALIWLYTMKPPFVAALQQKLPLALVVFAYFDVLLAQVGDTWYLKGWSRHIMAGVCKHLHADYRQWLDWPLQSVDNAFAGLDPTPQSQNLIDP